MDSINSDKYEKLCDKLAELQMKFSEIKVEK
jgi:hypothetical protein